ncbi:MAG: DUF4297 domain-containing protein [Deltaproteobacteria bacterium]|nr:DUF4297 domain-containing protein [Kofleriaceae bacterium]
MSENQVQAAASPADRLDLVDPGDETQRNFRYQHAYGVVLLVASATGLRAYTAIWCEHHEDFLAELTDGHFDAFQIKTRRVDDGPWKLGDGPLRDSIKRFVRLSTQFPGAVTTFKFVSNIEIFDSNSARELTKCPLRLCAAVKAAGGPPDGEWAAAFESLRAHCACSPTELVEVLAKLEFIQGPSREGFDAEVAHGHVAKHPRCEHLSAAQLSAVRDEIIQKVFAASSLQIDNPEKHLCPIDAIDRRNPALLAKRIEVSVVDEVLHEQGRAPFRMQPTRRYLALTGTKQQLSVLGQKFVRAGLVNQLETMQERALSAERHLLSQAYRNDAIDKVMDQIESVVKGECDEAKLAASLTSPEGYGPLMLTDVHARLRRLAREEPELVAYQTSLCLIGVAGLLTDECRVWWSDPFPIEDDS